MVAAGRFPVGRSAPPAARSGGGETLRGLVVLYRRLSALAAAPDGPGAVTRLLTGELRVVAAVVAPDSTVLAASAPGVDEARAAAVLRAEIAEPRWERVLAAAARGGRALRVPGSGTWVRVVVPVEVAGSVAGFLVAEEDPGEDVRPAGDDVVLLAAEHAATIVGVLLGRERVLAVAAGQVRDDLISGLVLGRARSSAEAAQWAEHVGLDADRTHRVLVVVPAAPAEEEGTAPAELLATVRDRIARLVPDVLAVVRDREVVAVIPADADPEGVGNRVATGMARGREPWPVTVALGREVPDVAGLPGSYDQAHRTVEAARRLGREGRLLRFEDLGVHRLLLQVPDPEDARVFAREVLGRLATDPSERTVELIRTLARYFREDGSPQRTAKVLSVHPNTVGYRLRRAEELSGLVLDQYRDRLAAQVALEILGWME
ncbi:PucR family transcriptional regulator [Actinomycetospora atypica]|uniref:PucR family transcriptional regulator n=1 Tax=Actinomycetospora atypica TaxID=1290095 RepID=A0ABV9YTQ7_9PSEU